MESFVFSIVGFLLAITILVAVHEFGHFWVARRCGVKVLRFSIGFGKPIWRKRFGVDKTEFCLGSIPLGGYVKMLGENDPNAVLEQHELHRAFDNQALWKKAAIVVAGPAINFIFAIILLTGLALMPSKKLAPVLGELPPNSLLAEHGAASGDKVISIDGRALEYFSQYDLYIFNRVISEDNVRIKLQSAAGLEKRIDIKTSAIPIYNFKPDAVVRHIGLIPVYPSVTTNLLRVLPDSPAALAGLQVGDTIVEIERKPIRNWSELSAIIRQSAGQKLRIDIERKGVRIPLWLKPKARTLQAGETIGYIGVVPDVLPLPERYYVQKTPSFLSAVAFALEEVWLISSVSIKMLGKMLTRQVSHTQINGPIAIAQVSGNAIQVGFTPFIYILAIVSISLGVMNLLPIPMLDGGHLAAYAYEWVAGKPVSDKIMLLLQKLGIVFLLGLMSLAFYNDIFSLLH